MGLVHLNGVELALGPRDELPEFTPEATAEGAISLAPATTNDGAKGPP